MYSSALARHVASSVWCTTILQNESLKLFVISDSFPPMHSEAIWKLRSTCGRLKRLHDYPDISRLGSTRLPQPCAANPVDDLGAIRFISAELHLELSVVQIHAENASLPYSCTDVDILISCMMHQDQIGPFVTVSE